MNLRTCIICRQKKDKFFMIRIVRTPEGLFRIDETFKCNGRGAYICVNSKCISTVIKKQNLNRVFHAEVPNNIYESLSDINIHMEKNFYNFIGIAAKANKIIYGTTACESGIEKNIVHLIILDKDLSEKTKKEFIFKCKSNGIPMIITKNNLGIGNMIGRPNIRIIAVTDQNMACEVLNKFNKFCGGTDIE